MQQAIDLQEVGNALGGVIERFDLGHAEAYVTVDGTLRPATGSPVFREKAAEALETDQWGGSDPFLHPLIFGGEVRGVLVHRSIRGDQRPQLDWSAVAALLTIAIERALLFGAAAEREALRRRT